MQGAKAFFATNHDSHSLRPPAQDALAFNETWAYYPDGQPLRSFFWGDQRAAIVPFLAYKCAPLTCVTFLTSK